jgi:tRNA(Leu) C34 or U34 (ribose-2'-O)-methylase TrmL
MATMISNFVGKDNKPYGNPPAVILCNPKYPHNVGATLRAASCYGINQVFYTGNRVSLSLEEKKRLPREERMKGYKDVELINFDYPLDTFKNVIPIAIEVRQNSELLPEFEHPENAVYVFGPEDGSIPKSILHLCHRFVIIPTKHCLNLSQAVNVVLYDRIFKQWINGKELPKLNENRGYPQFEMERE